MFFLTDCSLAFNRIQWGGLYGVCSGCAGKSSGRFETLLTSFSLLVQSFSWEMDPLGSSALWISCCRLASKWCCCSDLLHLSVSPYRLCLHYCHFSLLLLFAVLTKTAVKCRRFCYIYHISSRCIVISCSTHRPALEPSWWTALSGLFL